MSSGCHLKAGLKAWNVPQSLSQFPRSWRDSSFTGSLQSVHSLKCLIRLPARCFIRWYADSESSTTVWDVWGFESFEVTDDINQLKLWVDGSTGLILLPGHTSEGWYDLQVTCHVAVPCSVMKNCTRTGWLHHLPGRRRLAKNSQKKTLAVEISQELFHKLHPLQTLRLDQFLRAVWMGSTPTSQAFRCRRETLGSDRRQMEGATKKTGTRNGRQRGFARKLAGLAVQSP